MTQPEYQLDVYLRKTLHESYYVEHQHSTVRFQIPHSGDLRVLEKYFEDHRLVFLKILVKI